MRALMWVLIAVAAVGSLIIGLTGCHPVVAQPGIAGGCNKAGICCYVLPSGDALSCVATKVQITVSPGEIKDENLSWSGGIVRRPEASFSQGGAQTGGEVSSGALEARISQQLVGGGIDP